MKRINHLWKPLFRPLLCTLACGTVLAGCAPATTQSTLRSYDVPSDRCNSYRQPLIATSTELNQWSFMGKSALTGAALGAIAGGLIGGDAKGALIGGALGGVAGAAYGHHQYLKARQQQAQSRQELIDGINGDAYADTARVREITDSIRRLGACRRDQVDEIKGELKRNTITKEQALARADEVKATSAQDKSLIREVLGKVDNRYEVYVDSKAEVLGVDRTKVAAAQPTQKEIAAIRAKDLRPTSGTYQVKSGANIRKGPSTSTAKIAHLPANRKIEVTGKTRDGNWYAFDHQGKTAFIYATLVTKAKPKDEVIAMGQASQVAHNTADDEELSLDRTLSGLYASIGEKEEGKPG